MNAYAQVSLPSTTAAEAAAHAVEMLRDLRGPTAPGLELRPQGQTTKFTVEVPPEVAGVLLRVLSFMAAGHAVTILPIEAELTTQKAADMLGVSRPYLIQLLDKGQIPYHRVGSHRRIKVADLLRYRNEDDQRRRNVADELTAEAERLGLGY